jgi:hypothetical protein
MENIESLGHVWAWEHEGRWVYAHDKADPAAVECELLSLGGATVLQCIAGYEGRLIWGATEWQG